MILYFLSFLYHFLCVTALTLSSAFFAFFSLLNMLCCVCESDFFLFRSFVHCGRFLQLRNYLQLKCCCSLFFILAMLVFFFEAKSFHTPAFESMGPLLCCLSQLSDSLYNSMGFFLLCAQKQDTHTHKIRRKKRETINGLCESRDSFTQGNFPFL